MTTIAFWVLATVSVGCAVALLCQRNTVRCAVALIGVMLALAGQYLLLGAEFVAAAQVIVYAGAVMVLFLFVIMLLGGQPVERAGERRGLHSPALLIILALMAAFLVAAAAGHYCVLRGPHEPAALQTDFGGNVQAVAAWLLTRYLYPFEVTSVILLIGMIAVVVLAKRETRDT